MSISANYPQPVQVNGFMCKNCTDVDYAKKHIDPAHPKAGPYGVNAATDPSVKSEAAFRFGGRLNGIQAASGSVSTAQATAPGQSLNITA